MTWRAKFALTQYILIRMIKAIQEKLRRWDQSIESMSRSRSPESPQVSTRFSFVGDIFYLKPAEIVIKKTAWPGSAFLPPR
jgi:hypothetical protein